MGLNDLLHKWGSKKYGRFNMLVEGINRDIWNSIAHRDFKVTQADGYSDAADEVASRILDATITTR